MRSFEVQRFLNSPAGEVQQGQPMILNLELFQTLRRIELIEIDIYWLVLKFKSIKAAELKNKIPVTRNNMLTPGAIFA